MEFVFKVPQHLEHLKDEEGKPLALPMVGEIKFKIASYVERARYQRELVYRFGADGERYDRDPYEQAEKFFEIASKHVTSVQLKRMDTDYEFKSLDDLGMDEHGGLIIVNVGKKIAGGIPMGKP